MSRTREVADRSGIINYSVLKKLGVWFMVLGPGPASWGYGWWGNGGGMAVAVGSWCVCVYRRNWKLRRRTTSLKKKKGATASFIGEVECALSINMTLRIKKGVQLIFQYRNWRGGNKSQWGRTGGSWWVSGLVGVLFIYFLFYFHIFLIN